jgi:hypothetical protein
MNVIDGADADAIRGHVARVTSSELFVGAERLCRFLRFTVESKLNGREADVKEYTLGREVFDRGETYDPRLDPIVRVEARRLRSRLAEYYGGPGRDESLRLEYPKGSYVPVVCDAGNLAAGPLAAPVRRPWWIAGPAAFVVVALIAAVMVPRMMPAPMIAPIPATWMQPNDGTLDSLDVALAQTVDEELANQPSARVVAWPEIARHADIRGAALRDVASSLGASQLLVILVRKTGATRRISVFAIEEPEGRKRLALTYYADASLGTFEVQRTYAERIVRDLGYSGRTK